MIIWNESCSQPIGLNYNGPDFNSFFIKLDSSYHVLYYCSWDTLREKIDPHPNAADVIKKIKMNCYRFQSWSYVWMLWNSFTWLMSQNLSAPPVNHICSRLLFTASSKNATFSSGSTEPWCCNGHIWNGGGNKAVPRGWANTWLGSL